MAESGIQNPADIAELSYEQARDELVRVVNELEQGSVTLEQSLALWERGEALARRCEQWLMGAKERLDAARNAATGGAGSTTSAGAPPAES
ncbi:exodeoxyribonuclease VII small subunit [Lysinimonas soli]|uniref:Exodeoxyribonuclease 7 small subunit n=1 Tax=Lysinimonas soli TaxID=1074233 RepID=A0ABW0NLQ7_9MICO